jgi:hypothetical protein
MPGCPIGHPQHVPARFRAIAQARYGPDVRHFRSILYAAVLAPTIWVLAAAGLTHESWTGLLMLLLGGAAYGLLLFAPISPLGPAVAGVLFLAAGGWATASPSSYADVWPASGWDPSRPGYALATLLSVPMILTLRRWFAPRLAAPAGQFAPGTPAATMPADVDERTTVLRLPEDRTTLLHRPSASPSPFPGGAVDGEPTTVLRRMPTTVPLPDEQPTEDVREEPPTIDVAEELPEALPAALPAAGVVAEEPTAAIEAVEDPTENVVAEELTADLASEEPTDNVVAEDPPTVVAEPAAEDAVDESLTEAIPLGTEPDADDGTDFEAGAEPIQAATDQPATEAADAVDGVEGAEAESDRAEKAEAAQDEAARNEPADEVEAAENEPAQDEAAEDEAAQDEAAEDEAAQDEAAEDEAAQDEAAEEVGADKGEAADEPPVRMEGETGESGDRADEDEGVRADAGVGERTVDLSGLLAGNAPLVGVAAGWPDPGAGDGESAEQVAPPGERTVEVRPGNRSSGDATQVLVAPGEQTQIISRRDMDDTQVIRLRDDGERTQLLSGLVRRPAGGRAGSIAGAESPNFADDPTGKIVPPAEQPEEAARTMTVMNMERPPDGPIVPAPRRSPESDD